MRFQEPRPALVYKESGLLIWHHRQFVAKAVRQGFSRWRFKVYDPKSPSYHMLDEVVASGTVEGIGNLYRQVVRALERAPYTKPWEGKPG